MQDFRLAIAFFGLASLHTIAAHGQTPTSPKELAAGLSLEHRLRDMMSIKWTQYDVQVSLVLQPKGDARLRLHGTLQSKLAELTHGNPASTRTPPAPVRLPVDESWTGRAHQEQETLVVEFATTDAYKPAMAVEVVWRCTPTTIAVADQATTAWTCQTSQSMTRRSGPSFPLPPYLQVPLSLSLPSTRLQVTAVARGGANHRSSIEHASYSRRP